MGLDIWKGRGEKNREAKISLRDIGAPDSNTFLHVQGVKPCDSAGGFEMHKNSELERMDPRIKQFLMIAGLDEKMFADPQKAKQVKEWAESKDVYNVMDNNAETLARRKPPIRPTKPPKPPRDPQKCYMNREGSAPPPPPPPPPLKQASPQRTDKRVSSPHFLDELGGAKLNHVPGPDNREIKSPDEGEKRLQDLISEAMEIWRPAICSSDEEEYEESGDSDWSDD